MFSDDSRFLAAALDQGLALIELPSGNELPELGAEGADHVGFSADGSTIALAYHAEVTVFDAKTRTKFGQFPKHLGVLRQNREISLTPDGGAVLEEAELYPYLWLAVKRPGKSSASSDWRAGNLEGHIRPVRLAMFVEGDRFVLSISDRIMLHRVSDGEGLELVYDERPAPHGAFVVVTPDGRFDGPPGSLDLLRERKGDRLIPVSPRSEGYTPGLYQRWLAR